MTTGGHNICIGKDTGNAITTSSRNVCIGNDAGRGITTQTNGYNVYVGDLCANVGTGTMNVGMGQQALESG